RASLLGKRILLLLKFDRANLLPIRVVPAWVSFGITTNLGLRSPTGRQSRMDIDMIRVIRRDPRSPNILVFPPSLLQTTFSPNKPFNLPYTTAKFYMLLSTQKPGSHHHVALYILWCPLHSLCGRKSWLIDKKELTISTHGPLQHLRKFFFFSPSPSTREESTLLTFPSRVMPQMSEDPYRVTPLYNALFVQHA
uniref:Uncharacterized protein n=1 Tax=Cucumis melo TaxID=3656 RepID=A0A9I9EBD4_CUCME